MNDRFIPKIHDNGYIDGSFLMMNVFYTEMKILKVP